LTGDPIDRIPLLVAGRDEPELDDFGTLACDEFITVAGPRALDGLSPPKLGRENAAPGDAPPASIFLWL